jgi:hypothetical protein
LREVSASSMAAPYLDSMIGAERQSNSHVLTDNGF